MDFININWVGHLSFILTATAFCLRDMLLLRLIAVLSSMIGVIYNIFAPQGPLWIAIFWLSIFTVINLARIVHLIWERRQVDLSEEEQEIHETQFTTMSPVEFRKLIRVGEWATYKEGSHLAKHGEPLEHLMLIYNGKVSITRGGQELAVCGDGSLIGEVSFMHKGTATATASASVETKCLKWESEKLRALLARNPSMNIAMQAVFSADLIKKLVS